MSYLARSIRQNDYSSLNAITTLAVPQHNLTLIRTIGRERTIQPRPTSDEYTLGTGIVKTALKKFATDEVRDKVINGFRRSDGSNLAAEINFLNSDLPKHTLVRDSHYLRALRVTAKLFKPSRILKPVAFPDLRYYPWTLSTSAEAPFTMKQKWKDHVKAKHSLGLTTEARLNFHNLYNEIFEKNRYLIHDIKVKDKKFFTPAGTPIPYYWHSLHTRAHLVQSDEEDKNRAVFGTPKLLLMAENMFLWPLQKEYLNHKVESPLLWGYETFKGGWKKLWNNIYSRANPHTFIGIDWSGFDRKALFEVIDDVHDIWKSYFTFDEGYEPTNEYPDSQTPDTKEKINNLWTWMTYSIKHTPILAPSDRLYKFNWNGIASGYQQTQLMDSFVNTIMILTCLSQLGINIESDKFILFVQGDDSLIALPERMFTIYGKHFLTMIANEALKRFNATLSTEKSTISDNLNDIEVLSYSNRYGIAYRNEEYLLAQLLHPERPTRKLGALASAAVGIAMASMGQSKLVYQVCFDTWDYIVNTLGHTPRPINLTRWMTEDLSLYITGSTFPSMTELKDQQEFTNKTRTYAEQQRLWPSDPKEEFFFLSD
jgi:hypothetical protein